MKKFASVVGTAILLATAMPAGATSNRPDYGADATQMAFASWLVEEDGQKVLYFGAGMNEAPSTEFSLGFIGRAPCKEIESHGRKGLRCRGAARGHGLTPGEFVFDPSLNTATLTMDTKGQSHSIAWEGQGDLSEPYWHQHSGTGFGVMVMAMMSRRANTVGNLFGRNMEGKGSLFEFAYVEVSGLAFIHNSDGTGISLRDGGLQVSRTIF